MIPIWFGRWAVDSLVYTIGGSIPSVLKSGINRSYLFIFQ
jgi:hypothetical protein